MLSVDVSHPMQGFDLNVAFEAPPGLTVLFGRSGSGKTTVINAVAGLLRAERARVAVNGQVLSDTDQALWQPPHKRRLGYVFQEGRLFPHLSVKQNLRFGQWFAPKDAPQEDMARVVEMLGIGDLLSRRPASLSGGEKQRVAIGRALLASPRLILADEPLAALDEARKAEILPYFERLRDETGVPILYVSHSPTEVARLATTLVALDEGRVVQQGPAIEVLGDPLFTPSGVRSVGAVIEARIAQHHDDSLSELEAGGIPLFLPHVGLDLGTPLRVRIAAQDVMLSLEKPTGISALNILEGRIDQVRSGEGPVAIVSLDTSAGRVLARVTRRSVEAMGLAPGLKVYAVVKTVSIAPQDVGG
ncbi:molybdenum ABC transporter ATP-binding protein [uncultured Shimia sp.]|uniref:molybdenum ABC transporter ATP-binding protein n=1 Tax=uncultured Shimia sp. TaxID=573152 RepID=UPI00263138AE|nr:molybdenum ABC transporter ATP-binding protein [uncultured Shimia sp.]